MKALLSVIGGILVFSLSPIASATLSPTKDPDMPIYSAFMASVIPYFQHKDKALTGTSTSLETSMEGVEDLIHQINEEGTPIGNEPDSYCKTAARFLLPIAAERAVLNDYPRAYLSDTNLDLQWKRYLLVIGGDNAFNAVSVYFNKNGISVQKIIDAGGKEISGDYVDGFKDTQTRMTNACMDQIN